MIDWHSDISTSTFFFFQIIQKEIQLANRIQLISSSSLFERAMLIFQGTVLDIFNVTIKFSAEGQLFSSPIFECSDLQIYFLKAKMFNVSQFLKATSDHLRYLPIAIFQISMKNRPFFH